jgi:hypothetical protein
LYSDGTFGLSFICIIDLSIYNATITAMKRVTPIDGYTLSTLIEIGINA